MYCCLNVRIKIWTNCFIVLFCCYMRDREMVNHMLLSMLLQSSLTKLNFRKFCHNKKQTEMAFHEWSYLHTEYNWRKRYSSTEIILLMHLTLKYMKKFIFSEDRNVRTEIKLCQIAIKLQLNILWYWAVEHMKGPLGEFRYLS